VDLLIFDYNTEVWFSFNYPLNAIILNDENSNESDEKYSYQLGITNIWEGDEMPMNLSAEEEANTIQALASWEFWENADFVFEESKKVIPVANIFGQDYMVLAHFEVCNVTLEKNLLFYYNNKVIKITSFFPTDKLIELMPE